MLAHNWTGVQKCCWEYFLHISVNLVAEKYGSNNPGYPHNVPDMQILASVMLLYELKVFLQLFWEFMHLLRWSHTSSLKTNVELISPAFTPEGTSSQNSVFIHCLCCGWQLPYTDASAAVLLMWWSQTPSLLCKSCQVFSWSCIHSGTNSIQFLPQYMTFIYSLTVWSGTSCFEAFWPICTLYSSLEVVHQEILRCVCNDTTLSNCT